MCLCLNYTISQFIGLLYDAYKAIFCNTNTAANTYERTRAQYSPSQTKLVVGGGREIEADFSAVLSHKPS